ncbi:hypothetical protein D3C74_267350 [compost metagenome]
MSSVDAVHVKFTEGIVVTVPTRFVGVVGGLSVVDEDFFTQTETEPPLTLKSPLPEELMVTVSERFPVMSYQVSPACCVPTYIVFEPLAPSEINVAKPEFGFAARPSRVQPMIS